MWSESKFHFIKISERSIEAEVKISSIKTFCTMIFKYGISLPNAESESNNLLTTKCEWCVQKVSRISFFLMWWLNYNRAMYFTNKMNKKTCKIEFLELPHHELWNVTFQCGIRYRDYHVYERLRYIDVLDENPSCTLFASAGFIEIERSTFVQIKASKKFIIDIWTKLKLFNNLEANTKVK